MKLKINIGICSTSRTSRRSVGDFAQSGAVCSKVCCGTEQYFLWCKREENILSIVWFLSDWNSFGLRGWCWKGDMHHSCM